MTIKHRLFISNILMIALPIVLSTVMWAVAGILYFNITRENPDDISEWITEHGASRAGILYTVVESAADAEALEAAGYSLVSGEVAAYKSDTRGYLLVFPDGMPMPERMVAPADFRLAYVLFLLIMISAVFLINRALTKLVFKSIMFPINTLVSGVHEIRDGNLEYRIIYENNDEFAPVCADFNEMTARLRELVIARYKDEQSRRELMAGISHDLRTPLTSIKAYIEGIEKGVAQTDGMKEKYLKTIKNKAADLEYIINQLFLFSKLDVGEFPFKLERVDITETLAAAVAEAAEIYADKGLSVLFNGADNGEAPSRLYCKIDIVQFKNMFYNILNNSVKYKIKDTVCSEIECKDCGEYVKISIADDGPGVAPEKCSKLFDIFYRGEASRKNPNEGSGLGLAIAYKIAERLGGSIKAENRDTGGLIINITIPKDF